jgi:outer membrane protein assembly factor BamB
MWRRRIAASFLALTVSAGGSVSAQDSPALPASGDGWPQWRGGPQRSGAAANAKVLADLAAGATLNEVWRSEALPSGYGHQNACVVGQGSPVVCNGKVYLYVNWPDTNSLQEGRARIPDRVRDTVICLDLTSGKTQWKTEMPGRSWRWGCSATLAVAAGKVVAVGGAGECFCLDATTGKELWRRNEEAQPSAKYTDLICSLHSSALIYDGLAVFISGKQSQRLYACDLEAGAVKWSADIANQSWSSPVAWRHGGGWTLVAGRAGYDPSGGKLLWKGLTHGWGTPAVEGEHCAVMGGKGLLIYRLSGAGPERIAEIQIDNGSGNPAILDGRVYACGAKAAPAANPTDPENKETQDEPVPAGKPAEKAKKPATIGALICVEAKTGAVVWETTDPEWSPGGGQWSFTSVTVGSGVVCVLNGNQVRFFTAENGKRLAGPLVADNLKGGTSLAVAGDYLVTRGTKAVVCYKAQRPSQEKEQ